MTTPATAPRCDESDLPVIMCAHCRDVDDRITRDGPPRPAAYADACAHCGAAIDPGDPIAPTPDGWALYGHTRPLGGTA